MLNEVKSSSAGDDNSTADNENEIQSNSLTLATQGEALRGSENQDTPKSKRQIPYLKILIFGIVGIITLLALGLIAQLMMNQNKTKNIFSYEECVEAGYPIMESYPEQCVAGGQTFARELTPNEIEKLNPGIYEGDEFSFEYPAETFALAHQVCNNNSSSPALIEKSSNNKYSNVGCVYGIIFDIYKVDKANEFNPVCYSINKEQILVDEKPATSYTAKFIGAYIERCTEGMLRMASGTHRYIYVKNENQMYLLEWPVLENTNQSAYDQILSTFKFTDTNEMSSASSADETTVDTSNWKTYTGNDFSIDYPSNFVVKDENISLDDIYKTGNLITFNKNDSFGLSILSSYNVKGLNIDSALGNGPGFSYVEECMGDFKPNKFKIDYVDAVGGIVGCGISGEEIDIIWFKGNKIYQAGGRENDYQTLLKMLSTLKFTE